MSEEFNHTHLRSVVRHISLVQSSTQLLGERLIELGETQFGLTLIANGLCHDQSKFHGIEWDFLVRSTKDDAESIDKLKQSWNQHVKTNQHHPEYWGGLNEMPKIYIAEMVCDWYARSTEMGTDLRGWIKDEATKKYDMSLHGKAYKHIKKFVDILLDPEFKAVPLDE